MPRETKYGLLIGLLFILGMGVVLSGQVRPTRMSDQSDSMRHLVPPPAQETARTVVVIREQPRTSSPAPAAPATSTVVASRPPQGRPDYPAADEPSRPAPPDLPAPPPSRVPGESLVVRSQTAPGESRLVSINESTTSPSVPVSAMVNPVAPRFDAPSVPVGWSVYTVQAGDYLGAISQKVYGTSRRWEVIFQANRDKLPSENMIREGMELRIPPMPDRTTTLVAATPPAAPPADTVVVRAPAERTVGDLAASPLLERVRIDAATRNVVVVGGDGQPREAEPSAERPRFVMYRVKDGDSLSSIAAEHLGSARHWTAVYSANKDRIVNPDVVPAGLEIKLPVDRLAARLQ